MLSNDMTSLQIHAEWGSLWQLAEAYVPARRIFAMSRGGQKRIVCVAGPWPSHLREGCWAGTVARRRSFWGLHYCYIL